MKKLIVLFVIFSAIYVQLKAQEITLQFNPKEPSIIIDSIKAINLVTGKTAFVTGSNTLYFNSFTTGIEVFPNSSKDIMVYPNPFTVKTELLFYADKEDVVTVVLTNSIGQVIAEKTKYISSGTHRFQITTESQGIYVVTIKGKHNKSSQKIISTNKYSHFSNQITYHGFEEVLKKEKSGSVEEGDLIHFWLYSGNNITKIADNPNASKTYIVEFHECKDSAGRNYPVVQIGDQWWMAENLAYEIPDKQILEDTEWGNNFSLDGWSYYNNDKATNGSLYGILYQYEAAKDACPKGWHLPSNTEWESLSNYLDGRTVAGGKLKKEGIEYWLMPNIGATNETGFSALPGGARLSHGGYMYIGRQGIWWSSSSISGIDNSQILYYEYAAFGMTYNNPDCGFSVRCIKDF